MGSRTESSIITLDDVAHGFFTSELGNHTVMLRSLPKAGSFNVAQTFAQALRLHDQERLQEAEPLYAQVLLARPDHVDALHMMGVIKLAKGQPAEALQFIAAAMQVREPSRRIFTRRPHS